MVYALADVERNAVYNKQDVPNFKAIATLVSLFSVFNTLGRMMVGFFSDIAVRKYGFNSRVLWLLGSVALMAVTSIWFTFSVVVPMMYVGIIILGIAYGGTFCVVPTLVTEFFGLGSFGANYGVMGMAPAIGSELLATVLAGKLNDYFKKNGEFYTIENDKRTSHCSGQECYRYAFVTTSGICIIATVIASWLWWRRRGQKATTYATVSTVAAKDAVE